MAGPSVMSATRLLVAEHCAYLHAQESRPRDFEYWFTEPLLVTGLFYGASAATILHRPDCLDLRGMAATVQRLQAPNGGFAGTEGHDATGMFTYSAVQLLALCGCLNTLDREAVIRFILSLQAPSGAFANDEYGQVDTRWVCW